jgi:outer membrane protein assembly factor BamE (lipoprotein component of BamABCDE complex)
MRKLGIIVTYLFIMSGCANTNTRGQYIDDNQINDIKLSATSKDDLIENFGTPSFVSDSNKNKWYYVSRLTKSNFLNRPKTISQRVLIVDFNNKNFVSSFELKDNEHLNNVKLTNEKTIIEGTEKGLINAYFSNIGKFSKSDKKKRKNK